MLGLINGLLVEVAQIDLFIATLGTGTILYALALWLTDGRQIIGALSPGFLDINALVDLQHSDPGDLCARPGHRPVDRQRAAAARPAYLRDRRQREGRGAQWHSRAGLCHRRVRGLRRDRWLHRLRARLEAQIGQANVGLDYLLPALVGAFLGSTTIKPGRVNVWGTIFGVLILAVGISGIQQLGGAFFVEPLFNGTTLVVSIALAAFAQRRRAGLRPRGLEQRGQRRFRKVWR